MTTGATDTRTRDYCASTIPAKANRCPQCSGEFRWCPAPTCRRLRGVKGWYWRGLLRGGLQRRCKFCTGPVPR